MDQDVATDIGMMGILSEIFPISQFERLPFAWSAALHNADDARRRARQRLPRMMFDFIDGAAGSEAGERRNRDAFMGIRLQPRVLVNIENCNLTTSLFGRTWCLPLGFAPMGMCDLSWPGADGFLAEQSVSRNIPHCVSTASSTTLEEMRTLAQDQVWFQLYAGTSHAMTEELIGRAETAGYDVLVLTVDTPKLSRRIRDLRNGFQVPFKLGPRQILDFALHPRWSVETLINGIPKPMNFEISEQGGQFVRGENRGATDWNYVKDLRARWKGKLVIKGVMSADDAVRIRDAGADAVYVSNHGGRQLDSAPAAIQALPRIRQAVGPDYPLIFDSGVRGGEDIVKALALGANFVMLGRSLMYATGAGGAQGLAALLDTTVEDLRVTMAQIGCTTIEQINRSVLSGDYEMETA